MFKNCYVDIHLKHSHSGSTTRRARASSPMTPWGRSSGSCSPHSLTRSWTASSRNWTRTAPGPWTLTSSVRWWWLARRRLIKYPINICNKNLASRYISLNKGQHVMSGNFNFPSVRSPYFDWRNDKIIAHTNGWSGRKSSYCVDYLVVTWWCRAN